MNACSGRASCPKTAVVINMRHHLVRAFHSTPVSDFGVLLALSALQSHTAHKFCRRGSYHASPCIRKPFTSKSQIYDHMLCLLRALLRRKEGSIVPRPYTFICLSMCLSIYLFICRYFMIFLSLAVYRSGVYLSDQLPTCLSIYLHTNHDRPPNEGFVESTVRSGLA